MHIDLLVNEFTNDYVTNVADEITGGGVILLVRMDVNMCDKLQSNGGS